MQWQRSRVRYIDVILSWDTMYHSSSSTSSYSTHFANLVMFGKDCRVYKHSVIECIPSGTVEYELGKAWAHSLIFCAEGIQYMANLTINLLCILLVYIHSRIIISSSWLQCYTVSRYPVVAHPPSVDALPSSATSWPLESRSQAALPKSPDYHLGWWSSQVN